MLNKKKKLLELVFEKAQKEIPNNNKTAIASYLNTIFEEKFDFHKNERTFVRFYTKLVEQGLDYNIDDITLDYMSKYIEYKDYDDFCNNFKNEPIIQDFGPVKVSISEENEHTDSLSDQLSKIIVTITNAPVFNFPEFLTKNKNGFGLVGIVIAGGFFIGQQQYTNEDDLGIFSSGSKKECMYWKEDHYEATSCKKRITGYQVIALDENLLTSLKRINEPDTLTVDNAIGKVWYDKSNNEVEFFTNYGIHPENGKTLRPVSKYIIDNYIDESY